MLARRLGCAQLTEAVRFRAGWEGTASLTIRAGEVPALADHDAHGRLHGGSYEEMAEQACRAWLAECLAGADVALTAFSHQECFDLSRRVRGTCSAGASSSLARGQSCPGTAAVGCVEWPGMAIPALRAVEPGMPF
jgi:hypothetical protein